ncbi:hypothetical protein GCK32_017644 [Trichostrongylus colubriformis]|uniref:Uncharacterized protein n=1 Tax=Trichostrongylus colubriformis TaxID=6319 RepID=A0AAN8IN00_TRICO
MLLILTVLAVFLVNTYGQGLTDCFGCIKPSKSEKIILAEDPIVNRTLVRLNQRWKSNVVWDEKLTKKALKAAEGSYKGRADVVVVAIQRFEQWERNDTTLAEKVEAALRRKFKRFEIIHYLSVFPRYGCNGIYDMEGEQDILTVACLYKAKIRKRE